MDISKILLTSETSVAGLFTATPKGRPVDLNGRHGQYVELADKTGKMLVLAADDSYVGPKFPAGTETLVCADLDILVHGRARTAELRKAYVLRTLDDPIISRNCDLFRRLQALIDELTIAPLKRFAQAVLANLKIAGPFRILPASWRHHHNYAGGLLEHSIEVAEVAAGVRRHGEFVRQCAIIAALFHDIGKIRTEAPGGLGILTRQNLDHDQLTIEILAAYLAVLDRGHWRAALILRSIWTRQYSHARICTEAMLANEIVRTADRASARFGGGATNRRSAGDRPSTQLRPY